MLNILKVVVAEVATTFLLVPSGLFSYFGNQSI